MIKIKSAQIPDFTDVNVRRVFGYAFDKLQGLKDQEGMAKLQEIEQNLVSMNRHISLEEIKQHNELWSYLQSILGTNHWTVNPDLGII